jgi:hypothetical protein
MKPYTAQTFYKRWVADDVRGHWRLHCIFFYTVSSLATATRMSFAAKENGVHEARHPFFG